MREISFRRGPGIPWRWKGTDLGILSLRCHFRVSPTRATSAQQQPGRRAWASRCRRGLNGWSHGSWSSAACLERYRSATRECDGRIPRWAPTWAACRSPQVRSACAAISGGKLYRALMSSASLATFEDSPARTVAGRQQAGWQADALWHARTGSGLAGDPPSMS